MKLVPWLNEPNVSNFEHKGFHCAVIRMPSMGHLCGYVGVPEEHPWFGKDYMNVDADVHGGLTFAAYGDENYHKVTHTEDGRKLWWLGFDCAHSGDLVPYSSHFSNDVYRNFGYVTRQTQTLADQAHDAFVGVEIE